MIERIEAKMQEVVEAILAKPANDFTRVDFEILSGEYFRLKSKLDSAESAKKMKEMLSNMLDK